MPTPNKGESQSDFVSRCIPIVMNEGTAKDNKQASAICYSIFRRHDKKESQFNNNIIGIETKGDKDKIIGGYIATTHLDSGHDYLNRGKRVRDKISKITLERWATEINEGVPRSNKMSIYHEREPQVSGVAVKGSAKVDQLPDGEYGLWVETLLDSTKDSFEDISYRLDNGLLDSFSIEYDTGFYSQNGYYENAAFEMDKGEFIERTLLPGTLLEGYTLLSQPMNEHAIRVKDIRGKIDIPEIKEDVIKKSKGDEVNMEQTLEVPKIEEKKVDPLFEEFNKWKEQKEKAERIAEIKEKVKAELKEELKEIKVEEKAMKNTESPVVEKKEYVEYLNVLKEPSKYDKAVQFKIAGKFAEAKGMFAEGLPKDKKSIWNREYKISDGSTKLEFKGLGLTTNQNSDTDYLLSAAELSDVFDPVIYNALNQAIVTWNLLAKDDFSNKGNNQVQFTLKTAANTTAGFYLGDAVSLGNVTRLKYMTKFKKAAVGVAVSGDMIAAARGGPIGDVFSKEVMDSTDDLLSVINAALFKEVGAETAEGVIGFEYITDSASNTTLYSLTRSTANKLAPDSAGDTYINGSSATISLTNLRSAIKQAVIEGASENNLVFITHPTQILLFKGLYDNLQRLVPTSSRFGFEGRPEFDGVPIFSDKDCNSDDWWLIDLETTRIAMWVPPTLEMLGKDSDAEKGFIKTYFALYYRAPRRIVQIYGNATS